MSHTNSSAERIHALITTAGRNAAAAGDEFNVVDIYVRALVRCGLSRDDAHAAIADPAQDPVGRILHFAGDSHNFAVLAITEALAAA